MPCKSDGSDPTANQSPRWSDRSSAIFGKAANTSGLCRLVRVDNTPAAETEVHLKLALAAAYCPESERLAGGAAT